MTNFLLLFFAIFCCQSPKNLNVEGRRLQLLHRSSEEPQKCGVNPNAACLRHRRHDQRGLQTQVLSIFHSQELALCFPNCVLPLQLSNRSEYSRVCKYFAFFMFCLDLILDMYILFGFNKKELKGFLKFHTGYKNKTQFF